MYQYIKSLKIIYYIIVFSKWIVKITWIGQDDKNSFYINSSRLTKHYTNYIFKKKIKHRPNHVPYFRRAAVA